MKQVIKFNNTSNGCPSYLLIDDFVDESTINEINSDFESFLSLNSNCDFYSDNGSRRNYVSGGKYLNKFLNHSSTFSNLYDNLKSDKFFKSVISDNRKVLINKGIKKNTKKFSGEGKDIIRFSPRWTFNWFLNKIITFTLKLPILGYLLQHLLFSFRGVEFACALASSSGGYDVKIHTDNRYKIVVGLIYLNELPQNSGGQTLFHKCVENENYEEISRVNPKPGRLVLFINSEDAYHSVKKYTGNIPRNFLYFSFNAVGLSSVWK